MTFSIFQAFGFANFTFKKNLFILRENEGYVFDTNPFLTKPVPKLSLAVSKQSFGI